MTILIRGGTVVNGLMMKGRAAPALRPARSLD